MTKLMTGTAVGRPAKESRQCDGLDATGKPYAEAISSLPIPRPDPS